MNTALRLSQRLRDRAVLLWHRFLESWRPLTVCQEIDAICSVCQLIGLASLVLYRHLPDFTNVFIGIGGFCAILKLLTRHEGLEKRDWQTRPIVAIAGFFLIIIACLLSS